MRCVAVIHCNTLQLTATHCSTLQLTATHCNTLQLTATHLPALVSHVYTHSNMMFCCMRLQRAATHCSMYCNTQHTHMRP